VNHELLSGNSTERSLLRSVRDPFAGLRLLSLYFDAIHGHRGCDTRGLALAGGTGTATITASMNGASGSTTLTVQ
jgi:hypothetical protein